MADRGGGGAPRPTVCRVIDAGFGRIAGSRGEPEVPLAATPEPLAPPVAVMMLGSWMPRPGDDVE